MKLGKVVYIAIILLLVAVFAVSAFHVGSYWFTSAKEKNQFDELAAMKEEDIQFLAESAYADACAPGNPKEASVEDMKALIRQLM